MHPKKLGVRTSGVKCIPDSIRPQHSKPLRQHDECNREWLLKNSVIGMSFWLRLSLLPSFFFSPQLSGSLHRGGCRLAEESHQSLEVLGCRGEEELLTNELHAT